MTDDNSRIARLEERMDTYDQWFSRHSEVGSDVALLHKCIEVQNGSVKRMADEQEKMNIKLDGIIAVYHERHGVEMMLKWGIPVVGISAIAQLVAGLFGK